MRLTYLNRNCRCANGWLAVGKFRNFRAFCFNEPATLIKNDHKELAVAVFLVASCVDVEEFQAVSFEGKISLIHFQNFAGFLWFSLIRFM